MKHTRIIIMTLLFAALSLTGAQSKDARTEIALTKPALTGGATLMQALGRRQSSRSFSNKPLPEGVLSGLLWAACGVNRPSGKRTAPTAMDRQEIGLYVAMQEGLYLYDAKKHALKLIVAEDLRSLTGRQGFVKDAFMNIVYVADMSSVAGGDKEEKALYAGADTGFIGQNVYLYCAANGLATVIRGWVDKEKLGKAMKLSKSQFIVLAQTVGYPEK
jgi:SagB-type dehydrogenase family enzyme